MSNRTLIEFNHDKVPVGDPIAGIHWLKSMMTYFSSGDPEDLPDGATFFHMRHHSEDCPIGEPPYGWENEKW